MKRTLLAVIGILTLLLGQYPGSVYAADPAPDQGVVPGPEQTVNSQGVSGSLSAGFGSTIYLPLITAVGQSNPPPATPYAASLSQALASCANTALNQVCYAAGSVTLDGSRSLATPGQVASLNGVSGLRLASPDAGHWSVALLRLAADSPTSGLGLTLLAFGNVEIHNLTLFDAAAGNGDAAPAFSFGSSPVPGQDPMTGGLIVYNPTHEEPLSIHLNGADFTLASSAVVQALPGVMTVTMAAGSALVQTAAGDGGVSQAHQLTVKLDGDGKATGAPTTPTSVDDDLLAPLVPPALRELEDQLIIDFESAFDHCMQGDSHQVYRVMYYARLLKLSGFISDEMMAYIDKEVSRCARFEVEFNSIVSGSSTVSSGSMHIQGQGMIVSFDMDGRLVQPASMPLTHLSYDFSAPPQCPYQYVLTDGVLNLTDAAMRINRNRLDISTTMAPLVIDEHLIYSCPGAPSVDLQSLAFWRAMFGALHMSELTGAGYVFSPSIWKYTGNKILAEAITTDRQAQFFDGVSSESMWMVMLHKPG